MKKCAYEEERGISVHTLFNLPFTFFIEDQWGNDTASRILYHALKSVRKEENKGGGDR